MAEKRVHAAPESATATPTPPQNSDTPTSNSNLHHQCNKVNCQNSCCLPPPTTSAVDKNTTSDDNFRRRQRENLLLALKQTWRDFNNAIRSPEPFDQFYWMKVLAVAAARLFYHVLRLDIVVGIVSTNVPILALVLILSIIASYFFLFHELVVLRRWCGPCYSQVEEDEKCNVDDPELSLSFCVWSIVHPVIVLYFGTMILFNYFATILASPGFALPSETVGRYNSKSLEKRGGFFSAKINIENERRLVALYGEMGQNDSDKEEESNQNNDSQCYFPSPQPSFCNKCQMMRPPRCHHCSKCNRCVLQMDHHCIWMNNCIGYNNYRTFVLSVAYLAAGCWYGVALLSPSFWSIMGDQISKHGLKFLYENKTGFLDLPPPWVIWEQIRKNGSVDSDVMIKIVFTFLCCVGILLTCFLMSHLGYIASAKTTLENSAWRSVNSRRRRQDINAERGATTDATNNPSTALTMGTSHIFNPFDQGRRANLEQIFGDNIFALFLPMRVCPPAPYIPNLKKKDS